MLEAGENPRMVMAQVGHTDAGLTLRIYAQVMKRCESRSISRVDAPLRETHGDKNPAEVTSGAPPPDPRQTEDRPSAGGPPKPSNGLEPLTPSLPWKCSTN